MRRPTDGPDAEPVHGAQRGLRSAHLRPVACAAVCKYSYKAPRNLTVCCNSFQNYRSMSDVDDGASADLLRVDELGARPVAEQVEPPPVRPTPTLVSGDGSRRDRKRPHGAVHHPTRWLAIQHVSASCSWGSTVSNHYQQALSRSDPTRPTGQFSPGTVAPPGAMAGSPGEVKGIRAALPRGITG
jgi:hypothetical protein